MIIGSQALSSASPNSISDPSLLNEKIPNKNIYPFASCLAFQYLAVQDRFFFAESIDIYILISKRHLFSTNKTRHVKYSHICITT